MDWLESQKVRYVLGLALNPVLKREVAALVKEFSKSQRANWDRYRRFHTFSYEAGSWSKKRRIVARLEASSLGVDVRFVVTD